jgi:lipopolysaccharide biosynthesis glycosyltransferase
MGRPDLASAFTKIELWRQTQFSRVVYIDADVVALRAPDELFNLESNFAAAPDVGWPDCFNSGVMALTPNLQDYYALLALARNGVSFDGADQGLLNMHFRNWERLSFTYNCTPSGNYQYAPAYKHFGSTINLVHFIGPDKPWNKRSATGVYGELLARWWAVHDRHFRAVSFDIQVFPSNNNNNDRRQSQDYLLLFSLQDPSNLYLRLAWSPSPSLCLDLSLHLNLILNLNLTINSSMTMHLNMSMNMSLNLNQGVKSPYTLDRNHYLLSKVRLKINRVNFRNHYSESEILWKSLKYPDGSLHLILNGILLSM